MERTKKLKIVFSSPKIIFDIWKQNDKNNEFYYKSEEMTVFNFFYVEGMKIVKERELFAELRNEKPLISDKLYNIFKNTYIIAIILFYLSNNTKIDKDGDYIYKYPTHSFNLLYNNKKNDWKNHYFYFNKNN